jgi:uroporphyrinogen-III synthase
LLRREGAEPVHFATIRIQPIDDWSAVDTTLRDIIHFDWVVFTSANAVRIWMERLHTLMLDARAMATVRVAAIGPVTADALQVAGVHVDLIPPESVAESALAALCAEGVAGQRILLPQAAAARKVLADGLEAAGAAITAVPLYDTLPVQEEVGAVLSEIATGRIDAVTFASSSTVRSFAGYAGAKEVVALLRGIKVACIGPITATTAREIGIRVDAVAAEHTIPGLVAALREVLPRDEFVESRNLSTHESQTAGEE